MKKVKELCLKNLRNLFFLKKNEIKYIIKFIDLWNKKFKMKLK